MTVDKDDANNADSTRPTTLDRMSPEDPLLDPLQDILGYSAS